jgi:predicted CopG family antitoxin
MNTTTIQVQEQTKKMLDELKEHPRETYDDVLMRLCRKALEASKHD